MPGSGNFPSSQGSAVYFGGVQIGYLTGWRVSPAVAQFEDYTNVTSSVWGSGTNARVLREYVCTAVEPGGADVSLYGCPPYAPTDVGAKAVLEVDFEGGSFEIDAFLETYEVTASAGELLMGTARFRFSGQDGSS